MTKNVYRDGPAAPGQIWAAPARSPQGQFGVLVGVGQVKVTFVEESKLDDYEVALVNSGGDAAPGWAGPSINMFRAAHRDLERFKSHWRASNAANN